MYREPEHLPIFLHRSTFFKNELNKPASFLHNGILPNNLHTFRDLIPYLLEVFLKQVAYFRELPYGNHILLHYCMIFFYQSADIFRVFFKNIQSTTLSGQACVLLQYLSWRPCPRGLLSPYRMIPSYGYQFALPLSTSPAFIRRS